MLTYRLFDDDFFAPFQRMERLFQNMDRFVNGAGRGSGLGFPTVHVLRRDSELRVRADQVARPRPARCQTSSIWTVRRCIHSPSTAC